MSLESRIKRLEQLTSRRLNAPAGQVGEHAAQAWAVVTAGWGAADFAWFKGAIDAARGNPAALLSDERLGQVCQAFEREFARLEPAAQGW